MFKAARFLRYAVAGLTLAALAPLPAQAGRFTPVSVEIPLFGIPSETSTPIQLAGASGLISTDQVIDLNARISPNGDQFPETKYQVSGKHCAVIDATLKANAPTVCRVLASRASSPFSPIAISEPALFSFGSPQNPLTITMDTSSVISIDTSTSLSVETSTITGLKKGQSLKLGTTGGSGTGQVSFKAEPGDTCLPISEGESDRNNFPLCTIIPTAGGSVCSIVGNILMTTASTVCKVRAFKDGDSTYLPANSAQISVGFGPGLDNQPIILHNATQAPLIISASPTSATLGQTITVTLSGGSGTGLYNFVLYQSGNACTITRTGATAYVTRATAGNCSIQGIRAADDTYKTALSSTLSLIWGQSVQNIPLVISNDPTSASSGDTINLTTVGGQGNGAVTFRVLGNYDPACVISGNQLTRATFGTCTIRATKAGDGVYAAQNSQDILFTYYGSKLQDPLVIGANSLFSRVGVAIALSTGGGSGGGAVTYQIVGGTGTGTITGSVLTASSAGTLTVIAVKQGDQLFASVVSAPSVFTFTG